MSDSKRVRDDHCLTKVGNRNDSLFNATIHSIKKLTNILSPSAQLTEIESEAFANLPNVNGIRIPGTLTSIADDAFTESDITILTPANSYAAQWAEGHGIPVVTE